MIKIKYVIIYITVILIGPSLWLISGWAPEKNYFISLINIPILIFLGFLWGRFISQKEILKLAEEIDKLELKNQDK